MKCPKCGTETLGEVFVENVAVDRCSTCDGIWFDAHELNQLLADDARQIASLRRGSTHEQADAKKGRCPRDDSDLLRVFSAIEKTVVLDACPECRGIWLDGGEFTKLFAARRP
ncbi:MAG: zf-TFIIB domain-containing protein [Candidatus Binatia bacterium]